MFNFLKGKVQKIILAAVAEGLLCDLSQSSDKVFSSKMMGDGYFVQPSSKYLFSPVTGKIETIFPTKHAFTIKSAEGVAVLVHIGIDTVELAGKPFELTISDGQTVKAGEIIGTVDLSMIRALGKGTDIFVLFPELKAYQLDLSTGKQVAGGDQIGSLTIK